MRLSRPVPIRQPLILISQVQRSGGTLLSQLFDGHPECFAHPKELHIGSPDKSSWPDLDLSARSEAWFESLYEPPTFREFCRGYRKWGKGADESFERQPFLFLPTLQRALFLHECRRDPPREPRAILNAYMTSYFNAWLDYQNLYSHPKRWVTAFAARLSSSQPSIERFFRDYPEGRLISLIRSPHGWYASARKHDPAEYGDLERALSLWTTSTANAIDYRRRFGNRVILVRFEELLATPEAIMRALAEALEIPFSPTLLEPTFNGLPMKANSSYDVPSYGILASPAQRHSEQLTDAERAQIDAKTAALLREAHALALTP